MCPYDSWLSGLKSTFDKWGIWNLVGVIDCTSMTCCFIVDVWSHLPGQWGFHPVPYSTAESSLYLCLVTFSLKRQRSQWEVQALAGTDTSLQMIQGVNSQKYSAAAGGHTFWFLNLVPRWKLALEPQDETSQNEQFEDHCNIETERSYSVSHFEWRSFLQFTSQHVLLSLNSTVRSASLSLFSVFIYLFGCAVGGTACLHVACGILAVACGLLAPWPGFHLGLLLWEWESPDAWLPGESLCSFSFIGNCGMALA